MAPEVEAEIEAALVPIRAAHPGVTNDVAAKLLPEHLVQPFWERAVGRYLDAELARAEVPKWTAWWTHVEGGCGHRQEFVSVQGPAGPQAGCRCDGCGRPTALYDWEPGVGTESVGSEP